MHRTPGSGQLVIRRIEGPGFLLNVVRWAAGLWLPSIQTFIYPNFTVEKFAEI